MARHPFAGQAVIAAHITDGLEVSLSGIGQDKDRFRSRVEVADEPEDFRRLPGGWSGPGHLLPYEWSRYASASTASARRRIRIAYDPGKARCASTAPPGPRCAWKERKVPCPVRASRPTSASTRHQPPTPEAIMTRRHFHHIGRRTAKFGALRETPRSNGSPPYVSRPARPAKRPQWAGRWDGRRTPPGPAATADHPARPRAGRAPARSDRIRPGHRSPGPGRPPVGPRMYRSGGAGGKKRPCQSSADERHAPGSFLPASDGNQNPPGPVAPAAQSGRQWAGGIPSRAERGGTIHCNEAMKRFARTPTGERWASLVAPCTDQ